MQNGGNFHRRVNLSAGDGWPGSPIFGRFSLLKGLESRGVPYIARIRKNEVLNRMAKPYLTQPAGRPPDPVTAEALVP